MTFDQFLQIPIRIVKYPSSTLREQTKPVTEFDENLHRVSIMMLKTMYTNGGIGLAAPQVGLPYQLVVINPSGRQDNKEAEMVLTNITPISYGDRKRRLVEGCLSLPNVRGTVERSHRFLFSAQGLDGSVKKLAFEGITGRVVQHEYDHLIGKLIIDYFSTEDLNTVKPILQQMENGH